MQIFGLGFKKRGSAAAGCFFYIHVGEKNARAKGNERQHLQKNLTKCMQSRYTFSSNHNIHKSSSGLCFWVPDPFINRFL